MGESWECDLGDSMRVAIFEPDPGVFVARLASAWSEIGKSDPKLTREEALADLEQKLIPLARLLVPMVEACESKCEDFDPFGAWDQIPAHIRDDLATERGLAPPVSEIEKRDTDPSELVPEAMGG